MTDSTLTMNPTGGAEERRGDTKPALHVEWMERILAADNLRRAWRQVKANRGASGIDGMRIEDFPAYPRSTSGCAGVCACATGSSGAGYARRRHLLALGVGKRHAILTAISSKSYWRMSKTLATQVGMTNQWLKDQGLISVRDLWMKAHGYA